MSSLSQANAEEQYSETHKSETHSRGTSGMSAVWKNFQNLLLHERASQKYPWYWEKTANVLTIL